MNKIVSGINSVLGLVLLSATIVTSEALAQSTSETSGLDDLTRVGAKWCQLDDPATYRALKKKNKNSAVKCPMIARSQNLPDELVLDLPCNRKMVFRKVVVPSNSVLDHVEISLGNLVSSDRGSLTTDLVNSHRKEYLSGGFSHGKGLRDPKIKSKYENMEGRSYYIGKYEILSHQYDIWKGDFMALEEGALRQACGELKTQLSKVKVNKVRPAQNISWFDAVNFSREYSNWLLTNDRKRTKSGLEPLLPWEEGSTSYLRLPTEAEWEFAARGGVLGSDVNSGVYYVKDRKKGKIRSAAAKEVAIYSGSGGKILKKPKAPGLRMPNLLGIYDMVGNVDEIVFDMFRLPRPDRVHGQAGGYIVKGGNYISNETQITTGQRREVPFFQTNGELKPKTTGFRLLVSVPVFSYAPNKNIRWGAGGLNEPLNTALIKAKTDLAQSSDQNRMFADTQLRTLQKELKTGQLRQEDLAKSLKIIQLALERSNVELYERDRTARRERFKATSLAASNVAAIGRNLMNAYYYMNKKLESISDDDLNGMTEEERSKLADQITNHLNKYTDRNNSLNNAFNFYVSNIKEFAIEPEADIAEAISSVNLEFKQADVTIYKKYLELAEEHISSVRKTKGNLSRQELDKWLEAIDVAQKRRLELLKSLEQYQ